MVGDGDRLGLARLLELDPDLAAFRDRIGHVDVAVDAGVTLELPHALHRALAGLDADPAAHRRDTVVAVRERQLDRALLAGLDVAELGDFEAC